MKKYPLIVGLLVLATGAAGAQFGPVREGDRPKLDQQAAQVFGALREAVAPAAGSVVEVRVWRKRVGYGAVVAPGKVLTKLSEVINSSRNLSCRTDKGNWLPAKLTGVYRDMDLAILQVDGLRAEPLGLQGVEDLPLGSFLALVRPDGEATSMGVVSVLPRSLRESDRAYLGIRMDIDYQGLGVKIQSVEPGTGAAQAGLRRGDVVVGMNEIETNGNFELSTALQRLVPGQTITLNYRRGDDAKSARVTLGGRPVPERIARSRMDAMNALGGHRYSGVREDFREVIQTDMQIQPEDCGAPVVDLNGRPVGIAIARAGRIKSFIIPAATLADLLAKGAEKPSVKELALREDGGADLRDIEREKPGSNDPLDTMRRHMEDMRRLMEEIERQER
jgi:S1-C subfamily serine protease